MSRQFVSGPTWIQALSLILLLTIPAMAAAFDQVGIYFDESYNNYTISAPRHQHPPENRGRFQC